jgi:hypothetical protein
MSDRNVGYRGKWKEWLAIYAVVGVILYVIIYFAFFAGGGGGGTATFDAANSWE